ncbi:hypothetical protein HHL19_05965 [Streptomyces sp. R302]|uniref:hypothetical protein n=1 Tax=unclassified Streptomyces TaxID=2593676 RepID=UPI00145D3032|nr:MULTISPECIES: hypothetical protein [unclassified Streptomyces]NML53268.1 hypothetical protein [Streptomyces sp. R301]NML78222.1 hypothetical protein [Streptomyces sp. R302]
MADLKAVQAAKRTLAHRLAADSRVNGVGIGGNRTRYVIRVNLVDGDDRPDLPSEVDGVPVEAVIVGRMEVQPAH